MGKHTVNLIIFGLLAASLIPFWRSGGRTDLNFWEFVRNHTIFGDPVEYVPEEDYMEELSNQ